VKQAIAEGWNGGIWSNEPPSGSQKLQATLSSVSCTSATACIAVGTGGRLGSPAEPIAYVWNGGPVWTLQFMPNATGATTGELLGMSCTSATACIAVGSWGKAGPTSFSLAEQQS
jgi:hypothetical protein